jgi:hypothetical protein
MKRLIANLVVISILLVFISACGSWQKTAAVTYNGVAIALESSRNIVNNLCLEDKIDAAKCSEIKEKYLIARDKFREAGDLLSLSIDKSEELRKPDCRQASAEADALLYQVHATLVWIDEIIANYQ